MGKDTQKTTILREFSSGGAVFKKEGKKIFWLVAKTVPSELFPNAVWRLPKGWIDDEAEGIPGPMASGKVKADEDSVQKTAIREVAEEGGVEAAIIKKIGTSKYIYINPIRGKIMKFVTIYLMEYKSDLPGGFDGETSEIAWLSFDEAYKKLSFGREREVLKKANDLLEP